MEKSYSSKYTTEGGQWFPNQVVNASMSNIWSDIIVVLPSINGLLSYFRENIKIIIGDGNRISFWGDIWCWEIRLPEHFPRLFSLSLDKNESLKFFANNKLSSCNWNLRFMRQLLAWEEEEVARLHSMLGLGPVLLPRAEDSLIFKVKSMFN